VRIGELSLSFKPLVDRVLAGKPIDGELDSDSGPETMTKSFTGRAIALIEDAEGSYRAEWSECSNKIVDLARDADAAIEGWTERAVELAALLAKWVLYCDLSGVKPVSGDLRDNPILALIADTRATLAKPVPSSGPETRCGICDDTGSMSDGTVCPHLTLETETNHSTGEKI
jgi:hypothetical protein